MTTLELYKVRKSYGGVRALQDLSTVFGDGLTGIVGDNGAGKSTLMKIISGDIRPDSGSIMLDGRQLSLPSPAAARKEGIEALYQDLALADTLGISENVFLGRELMRRQFGLRILDRRRMLAATRETLDKVRIRIPDPLASVRSLSGGQRQAVAMARAVYFDAKVLLLDEPTAALGPKETNAVIEVVSALIEAGKLIIMVTHSIPQVLRLAQNILVMRAGSVVGSFNTEEVTEEILVHFMVGGG